MMCVLRLCRRLPGGENRRHVLHHHHLLLFALCIDCSSVSSRPLCRGAAVLWCCADAVGYCGERKQGRVSGTGWICDCPVKRRKIGDKLL
ncbi:hypothetical protein BGX38DRAFT_1218644, partial [Terfezia claveryi]